MGDGAEILAPDSVAYVKLSGSPAVVVQISKDRGNVQIPGTLQLILDWMRNDAIRRLGPFTRAEPLIHRPPLREPKPKRAYPGQG